MISDSDLLSSDSIALPFSVNLAALDIFFLVGYALERCKKEVYPKEYKGSFPLVVAHRVIG